MSDAQTSESSAAIKSLGLSGPLHRYLVDRGTPPDAILRELNDSVAQDERFDRVMVAISDGITMLRVR
jgi:hypothetical protein